MRLLFHGLALVVAMLIVAFANDAAYAQSSSNLPTIFDVRRSLPLDPEEEVTHDFYINAGPEAGLKKGVYISVVRSVPVHDPIQNKQQATLNIPIGKLHIIHVEKNIAVGRLQNELTDDERPTVEFEAVMIGDHVDLATMSSDAGKKSRPKKVRVARVAEPAVLEAKVTESQSAAPTFAQPVAPAAPPVSVPVAQPAPQTAPQAAPQTAPQPPSQPAPASVTPANGGPSPSASAPSKTGAPAIETPATPRAPAPTSAEREEAPSPPSYRRNSFPVAVAPDMLRVDDEFYAY